MAIRSTAIMIPAGSYRHRCCPRSSLAAAEELTAAPMPFLRNYVHEMLTLYTSQAVLHNRSSCCALRWLHHKGPLHRAAPTVSWQRIWDALQLDACRQARYECSRGEISCNLSICGMTLSLRVGCQGSLIWPHLATFLLPRVSRFSTNVCAE